MIRTTVIALSLLGLLACDSDIGAPCTDDERTTEQLRSDEGDVRMTGDARLACGSALCLSQNGAAPFCTATCDADADCPTGFACGRPIETGPFACDEFLDLGACQNDPTRQVRYCAQE